MKKLTKSEIIKVFTKIPSDFVDDFYSIIEKNTTDYPINVDIVCKWLQITKKQFLRTLHNSYKINEDYTEEYNTITTTKGHNYKKIMLSIDCFKRLCMRSKSIKSEEVRTYFIELDNFISHYSDQISDGIIKDIEKVAKKVKEYPNKDGPGYIYAIRASNEKSGLIKIGYASDLIQRLRVYDVGRAEDVELLYAFRTTYRKKVENCLKNLMEAKRFKKRKEIYEVDLDIIKKLITGCDKLSIDATQVKKKSDQNGKYYLMFMKEGGNNGDLYNQVQSISGSNQILRP